MKKFLFVILLFIGYTSLFAQSLDYNPGVNIRNLVVKQISRAEVSVNMQLEIADLNLGKNQQLYLTPSLFKESNADIHRVLPSVLVNGRNMHYVFLRDRKIAQNYTLDSELLYKKGAKELLDYQQYVSLEDWMLDEDVSLTLTIDTCGCGRLKGKDLITMSVDLDPAKKMLILPYPKPVVEVEKIFVHHGRARVQFEVDRTELHAEPYKCKRDGKILDNREQLKIIEDSLHYALNTPHVELYSLSIIGYASPESPYLHNVELASGRSKALLEYIEDKFHLPAEKCSYDYVPENWGEFRDMVTDSTRTDITDEQRANLLELIDRQALLPEEYDAKETELKTSKKFSALYKNTLLPEWFPILRCTEFYIRTHLKPMSDEQLREVLETEPELMSLNQIYRVALTYEHASKEFHNAMKAALKYYPEDPTANVNAAALAIEDKNYKLAEEYLDKADNSDDALILRGIVATHRGNYDEARRLFGKAGARPEAQENLKILENY